MEFFIIKNDEQQGPFTLEQLSGMNIMPDTPVWAEGMPDWTTADKVEALQPLVAYAPRVEGAPEPPAMPEPSAPQPPQWNPANASTTQQAPYTAPQQPYGYSAPQPQYAEPAAPKPKKSRTSLWVTLIILAVLAGILALTNPDKKDHCRAISNVTKDWTQDKIDDYLGGGLLGGLTKIVTAPLLSEVVEGVVDVDNYGVCSLGHIDLGESTTKVSFGIMGHVFTFNKAQIDEKIKEAIGMTFNDAVDAAKEGIDDLISGGDDEPDNVEGIVPEGDEEVTPEDRAESDFTMPEEVDTIMKTITKQGARMAEKAINKAIDEMFK
jgi:hypothetical protein